jgi:thiol:disulfide interchange protein DsbD
MRLPTPLFRLLHALFLIAVSALFTPAIAQFGAKNVVTTEQVRAELLAYAPEGVAPGKPVWLGLQMAHQPQWHTYWKNAGDAGQPTTLVWTLPAGLKAGDMAWPLPERLPLGPLVNYGFDGTVLLGAPLTVGADFKPAGAEVKIQLQASWLVCRTECVPQDGQFELMLPVQGSTAMNAQAFQALMQAQPQAHAGAAQLAVQGQRLQLTVQGLPAAWQGQTLALFPELPDVIEAAGAWTQSWAGTTWSASLPLAQPVADKPAQLPLLLVASPGGQRTGVRLLPTLPTQWPRAGESAPQAAAVASPAPAAMPSPQTDGAGFSMSVALALLGALVGGMILNLMPCVFPVLAIKVMGFTRHAEDHRGHAISGMAYTAGVITSFVALGALMLGLRAAGQELGWGFQLQSPAVVAGLAALFTVIGLNLVGLFEVGQVIPSSLAALEARRPAVDAWLSGVLAVLIASPCTAPFMGASLGLALSLPTALALAVFASIGVGMALPYLAASLWPAVARKLPRPGAWMDVFKRVMAFPMFATVVWLLWVLAQQTGIDGAAALLMLLVALTGIIWALTLSAGMRRWVAPFFIATSALLTWGIGSKVLEIQALAPATTECGPQASASQRWQPWAPGRVQALLEEGQPVFVDFTAAWCVTCQVNERSVLARQEVLDDFAQRHVALLKADWTRRDPAITEALAALGRNGVPVYALYAPGKPPVLLSEIISVADVRQALAGL